MTDWLSTVVDDLTVAFVWFIFFGGVVIGAAIVGLYWWSL